MLPAGTKFRVVSIEGPRQAVTDADLEVQQALRDVTEPTQRVITVEAVLPKVAPKKKPSLAMETIGADMRDGFINTVNNGNQV